MCLPLRLRNDAFLGTNASAKWTSVLTHDMGLAPFTELASTERSYCGDNLEWHHHGFWLLSWELYQSPCNTKIVVNFYGLQILTKNPKYETECIKIKQQVTLYKTGRKSHQVCIGRYLLFNEGLLNFRGMQNREVLTLILLLKDLKW
jgi:hypothetical protein